MTCYRDTKLYRQARCMSINVEHFPTHHARLVYLPLENKRLATASHNFKECLLTEATT